MAEYLTRDLKLGISKAPESEPGEPIPLVFGRNQTHHGYLLPPRRFQGKVEKLAGQPVSSWTVARGFPRTHRSEEEEMETQTQSAPEASEMPYCVICEQKVEHVEFEDVPETGSFRFIVRCHGVVETHWFKYDEVTINGRVTPRACGLQSFPKGRKPLREGAFMHELARATDTSSD